MNDSSNTNSIGKATTLKESAHSLLSSNSTLAVCGVLVSIVTIGFVLWIQGRMKHQKEVIEPIAHASLELENGLSLSGSELRRWVLQGDPRAKDERRRIWKDVIEKNLSVVGKAAKDGGNKQINSDLEELMGILQGIKYQEWVIEDISHAPLNIPAHSKYSTVLEDIRENIIPYLSQENHNDSVGHLEKGDFLRATVLALLNTIERDLSLLLDDYNTALANDLKNQIDELTELLKRDGTKDTGHGLNNDLRLEIFAYLEQSKQIALLRKNPDWNQTQTIYEKKLDPAEMRAVEIIEKISGFYNAELEDTSDSVFRWSFLILGLALLTGLLSLVSLYMSVRARERVLHAIGSDKSIGQYVLGDRIDSGGMGQVFEATHALMRRPAALKVLRSDLIGDSHCQIRFEKAVQATSKLSHPNTISIFDYGETKNGISYYAMEFLEGLNLNEWLEHLGPMPPNRLVRLLRQICGSLGEAHDLGILHRDLKPSNVMLANLGGIGDFVKVFDYGLAKSFTEGKYTEGNMFLIGAPDYVAPETIDDPNEGSPRSDIYSLGAMAYHLCTGSPVFPSSDLESSLNAHKNAPVEGLSKRLGAPVSKDLEAIVLGCLAKDPGSRPQTARHLMKLLIKADVPKWSQSDANHWWQGHGESLLAEVGAQRKINMGDDDLRVDFSE